MNNELTFKDANGIELKPGDVVLRAIGSKLTERTITSITFFASTDVEPDGKVAAPTFETYVKTEGVSNHRYYKGRVRRMGQLYTDDSCKIIKKVA